MCKKSSKMLTDNNGSQRMLAMIIFLVWKISGNYFLAMEV
jgi:hypothetical protein